MDMNLVELELGFDELLGGNFIYVAIAIAAILLLIIWKYCRSKARTN